MNVLSLLSLIWFCAVNFAYADKIDFAFRGGKSCTKICSLGIINCRSKIGKVPAVDWCKNNCLYPGKTNYENIHDGVLSCYEEKKLNYRGRVIQQDKKGCLVRIVQANRQIEVGNDVFLDHVKCNGLGLKKNDFIDFNKYYSVNKQQTILDNVNELQKPSLKLPPLQLTYRGRIVQSTDYGSNWIVEIIQINPQKPHLSVKVGETVSLERPKDLSSSPLKINDIIDFEGVEIKAAGQKPKKIYTNVIKVS